MTGLNNIPQLAQQIVASGRARIHIREEKWRLSSYEALLDSIPQHSIIFITVISNI